MEALLNQLRGAGVELQADGEQLRVLAPKGSMTPALHDALVAHKDGLLALLRSRLAQGDAPQLVPDPSRAHEPFALTDIQHAYWVGRHADTGGTSAHCYMELDSEGLDLPRLERSLQQVIARHGMLRAVVGDDGMQRVLTEVPAYRIATEDLREVPAPEQAAALDAMRRRLSHSRRDTAAWPLFEVCAAWLGEGRFRLLISVDLLVVDASSMFVLCRDWQRFYEQPQAPLPPLTLSYRDYAEFEKTLCSQAAFQRDQAYWTGRLSQLPPPPDLPLRASPESLANTAFVRRQTAFPVALSSRWKAGLRRHGGTLPVLLLTAFSDVLRAWSREEDFTLNVTTFNRQPVHPQVHDLIGDFTTTTLLAVRDRPGASFADRCRALQAQLVEDLAHTLYGGTRVLRDLARARGQAGVAAMPIVFTSTLSHGRHFEDAASHAPFPGKLTAGLSQTPQVWLDCQATERGGEVTVFWDAVEALFPAGLLDDMFERFGAWLRRLGEDEQAWIRPDPQPGLPDWQARLFQDVNRTRADLPPCTLHGPVLRQAEQRPGAVALVADETRLTYGALSQHVHRLARVLRQRGCAPNTLIGVSMEKGWEQVAAVLGILHAGAAYLPLDPRLPQARRWQLARQGQVSIVLTQEGLRQGVQWPEGVQVLSLADEEVRHADAAAFPSEALPTDLAYVIYTSGSTGVPKGVATTHLSAANTVQDINLRWGVSANDRVLAVSALHFDLSVYDIFGVLAAGGAVIMPSSAGAADPLHWTELIERHGVTLWNSVPQLLQLWIGAAERASQGRAPVGQSLRLAFLSGDWIPVLLPDRARAGRPSLEVVSLGGATEASIWSIGYPIARVDPAWKSIPYGKPLSNQTIHVLDPELRPCPVWAVGHLHIGGIGLAAGYWQDPERTAERFVVRPCDGERLYRTGDLGRWLPDGNVEFLGRDDFQVKVHGNRIELGEIEAVLRQQPGVGQALVRVHAGASGAPQLVAYVVASEADAAPLREALSRSLPAYMVPAHFLALPAFPLSANGKVDPQALPPPGMPTQAARRGPANADERRLFEVWKGVLGHGEFGMDDNLFLLGADSLALVQVASEVTARFGLGRKARQALLPRLFQAPTIAAFAPLLPAMMLDDADEAPSPEGLPTIVADRPNRHRPFPLSAMQRAYLAGRMEGMEYHSGTEHYFEIDYDEAVDPARFEQAFHAVLWWQRANLPVLNPDLQLEVPRTFAPPGIQLHDLRGRPCDEAAHELLRIRERLAPQAMPLDRWPWFAVELSLHGRQARVHVNASNFFMDAFSIRCFAHVKRLHDDPTYVLPELEIDYRDAVLAYEKLQASAAGRQSEHYWRSRLPALPPAPPVPLAAGENIRSRSVLRRREFTLPAATWSALTRHAHAHGLTATTAVTAAYADILATWSGSRHFIVSKMLTHRLPLHPQIREVLGNFAAVYPLEVDWREPASFAESARSLQLQSLKDAQHLHWSSAKVWQALNQLKQTPGRALSPFVVASGLDMPARDGVTHGRLETPQVLIDHQFWHLANGGFWAIWDVSERFFPAGAVDAMWAAYRRRLIQLAEDAQAWTSDSADAPAAAHPACAHRPPLSDKPAQAGETVAPRTPTEAAVAALWEEVLSVAPVGMRSDFFELGGESFTAIQVMTKVQQQFGRRLPMSALFEGRTVEHLARCLDQAPADPTPACPHKPEGTA